MTPETEAKINTMHDTLLVMKTEWTAHIKDHPKQPCDDMKEMKRNILKIAGVAIVSLAAALYKIIVGG